MNLSAVLYELEEAKRNNGDLSLFTERFYFKYNKPICQSIGEVELAPSPTRRPVAVIFATQDSYFAKISKLCPTLQSLLEIYGDIPVYTGHYDHLGGFHQAIEAVTTIKYYNLDQECKSAILSTL